MFRWMNKKTSNVLHMRKKCPNENKCNGKGDNIHGWRGGEKNRCPLMTLSSSASLGVVTRALNDHITSVGSGTPSKSNSSLILQNDSSSSFPCYRTCEINPDVVLVKDAGVSCNLIKPTNESREKTSTKRNRSYLFELSSIKRKISEYTKGFISNFHIGTSRKSCCNQNTEEESNKIPISEEYLDDEGRLCLKLRLVESTQLTNSQKSSGMSTVKKFPQKMKSDEIKVLLPYNEHPRDGLSTQTSSMYNYTSTASKKSTIVTQKSSHKVQFNDSGNHVSHKQLEHSITKEIGELKILESLLSDRQLSVGENLCNGEEKSSILTKLEEANEIKGEILETTPSISGAKSHDECPKQTLAILNDQRLTNVNLHAINIRIIRHKRR